MEELAREVLVHVAAEAIIVGVIALLVPGVWTCAKLWSRLNRAAADAIREAFWASVLDRTEPLSLARGMRAIAFLAKLPGLASDQAAAERNPSTNTSPPPPPAPTASDIPRLPSKGLSHAYVYESRGAIRVVRRGILVEEDLEKGPFDAADSGLEYVVLTDQDGKMRIATAATAARLRARAMGASAGEPPVQSP